MQYQKNVTLGGTWVKGSDVQSGIKAKLVSETVRIESQFKNEDGTSKMQDVSKIRFENKEEIFNIALNRATLNALVDAFGTESKDWIGKYLTTQTEKMVVAGKRVTALYLIPEGYQLREDENGYVVIDKGVTSGRDVDSIDYPEEVVNLDDIPF